MDVVLIPGCFPVSSRHCVVLHLTWMLPSSPDVSLSPAVTVWSSILHGCCPHPRMFPCVQSSLCGPPSYMDVVLIPGCFPESSRHCVVLHLTWMLSSSPDVSLCPVVTVWSSILHGCCPHPRMFP